MNYPSIKKCTRNLVVALMGVLALFSQAGASLLEQINWDQGSDNVLALKLDQHSGYVIRESENGGVIELVLRDTELSSDIRKPEPRGLVESTRLLVDGNDVRIQLNLTEPGRANIATTYEGFKVALSPLTEPAASIANQTNASNSGNVGNVAGAQASTDSSVSDGSLLGVLYSRIDGDRVQVDIRIEGDAPEPTVFKTVDPPRIAFDFQGVTNDSGTQFYTVDIAALSSIALAQDDTRTRVVLNLIDPADYKLNRVDTGYVLTLGTSAESASTTIAAQQQAGDSTPAQEFKINSKPGKHSIESIDFRRTPNGGGRVIIKLSDNEAAVDLQEQGPEIVALFTDTSLPPELEQRLDVIDFATPVTFIDTYADGRNAKLVIATTGRFKQTSVQSGSTLVLDVSPLTLAEIESERTDEFGYKGERLSLNFQRISVRAALQVIADFTGLNFVTSDAISGNLSLRLKDVPWDQALDVILQTKGLAMRQKGNVVWVAPAEEITAKERQALEAQQEVGELEPLVTELIRVSYAKVDDLAKILKNIQAVDPGVTSESIFGSVNVGEIKTEENSLLSPRGSVTVDSRTNSLLVQDTARKLAEIKDVIAQLDIPVRQVQIETRIVEAADTFSRNIGARLGFSRVTQQALFPGSSGSNIGDVYQSGSINATDEIRTEGFDDRDLDNALSVNLPAGAIGDDLPGQYAFTIAKLGSGFLSLLDLELSALEAEGNGKILANPKILTTDKQEASIEQGQERLTTFGSGFGTVATEGQRAVLSLTVTPQITPDDKVILDVQITNDSFVAANVDTINTKRIETQALLQNGETVVIGGIYQQEEFFQVTKVPLLGDIPFIGNFFKKKSTVDERSELLIFLTPRIIDPALAVQ